jgi:hypothetical protein
MERRPPLLQQRQTPCLRAPQRAANQVRASLKKYPYLARKSASTRSWPGSSFGVPFHLLGLILVQKGVKGGATMLSWCQEHMHACTHGCASEPLASPFPTHVHACMCSWPKPTCAGLSLAGSVCVGHWQAMCVWDTAGTKRKRKALAQTAEEKAIGAITQLRLACIHPQVQYFKIALP